MKDNISIFNGLIHCSNNELVNEDLLFKIIADYDYYNKFKNMVEDNSKVVTARIKRNTVEYRLQFNNKTDIDKFKKKHNKSIFMLRDKKIRIDIKVNGSIASVSFKMLTDKKGDDE